MAWASNVSRLVANQWRGYPLASCIGLVWGRFKTPALSCTRVVLGGALRTLASALLVCYTCLCVFGSMVPNG